MTPTAKPKRVAFPILVKSALLTGTVLTLAILILGLTWFREAKLQLEDTILSGLYALVEARGAQIESVKEQDFERTALIASRTRLRQCLVEGKITGYAAQEELVTRILQDAGNAVDSIVDVRVYAPDGQRIASSATRDTGAVGEAPDPAPLFLEDLTTRRFLLSPLYRSARGPVYDIWSTLLDPNANDAPPVGFLQCRFKANRILDIVSGRTGLGASGELLICRPENDGLAVVGPLRHSPSPPLSVTFSKKSPVAHPFLLALGGTSGILREARDYRGENVLVAYFPVVDERWALVAKIDHREAMAPIRQLWLWTIQAGLGVLVFGVAAAVFFARILTRPIHELHCGTQALARGEFDYRVDVRSRDEVGDLGRAFNQMAHRIQTITASRDELNDEVAERVTAEHRLLEAFAELRTRNAQMMDDLRMARDIQRSLMPGECPAFACADSQGRRRIVSFARFYRPSWALGGDFFDIRTDNPNRVMVLVCDVMGHGLRAALVTALIRGILEDLPPEPTCPGAILDSLNDGLLRILTQEDQLVFVTACCLIVEPLAGNLRFAAAGHPSPLLLPSDDGVCHPLYGDDEVDPVLGLDETIRYRVAECPFSPGDRLVAFTDGLYEAENKHGEMVGEARLRQFVVHQAKHSRTFGDADLQGVVKQIDRFTEGTEFEDDLCIVAINLTEESHTP